ncbi:MAG: hypothetical protein N2738_05015 [Thermodesulfovibrionales bacterium]|nr:hypothetical protein [Thermodesulfovibrionales bacterium]
MKIKLIFVLLFATLFSSCQHEIDKDDENWHLIVKSAEGNDYFIDKNSITYSNYLTVFAWYKMVPIKDKGFYEGLKNLKFFGADLIEASYYKVYSEIDCRRNQIKILITQAYSSNKRLLRREETLSAQWTPIPEGSSFDMIREIICKQYY